MGSVRFLPLALLACEPPCPESPPNAELGTGQDAFEPIEEGAMLQMFRGPQGGTHVFGSLQTSGLDGGSGPLVDDIPLVSFSLAVDDATVAEIPPRRTWVPGTEDQAELLGQLVVFGAPDPSVYAGMAATFSTTIEDRCGEVASDTVSVTLTQ